MRLTAALLLAAACGLARNAVTIRVDAAAPAGALKRGNCSYWNRPGWITSEGGSVHLEFSLPRHGVSLLRFAR